MQEVERKMFRGEIFRNSFLQGLEFFVQKCFTAIPPICKYKSNSGKCCAQMAPKLLKVQL